MKIQRVSELLLIALSVFAVTACSPQFNKKRGPGSSDSGSNAPGAPPVPWGGYVEYMNQHDAGGGVTGTSASFRLSGVTITQFGKGTSNSVNFKVKGGTDGQLH